MEAVSMARAVPGLDPLIAHLADAGAPIEPTWRDWRLQRIEGGGNNLLYRATRDGADLAIKFTISDDRDRAGREFIALSVLQQSGLGIAPEPVLLDRERYRMPVVVQTWLDGEVSPIPPEADDDWRRWLEHLATTHTITPERAIVTVPEVVITFRSAAEGLRRIRQQLAFMPVADQPAALRRLARDAEDRAYPSWPAPESTLCHGDGSVHNVVRRPGRWARVDWENSGWGDPAFEVADVIAHAAHLAVPAERWAWVAATYAGLSDDRSVSQRIRVYATLLLVWWAARLARTLYEIPRGRDQRLVPPPAGWQADRQARYERYLHAANQALAEA